MTLRQILDRGLAKHAAPNGGTTFIDPATISPAHAQAASAPYMTTVQEADAAARQQIIDGVKKWLPSATPAAPAQPSTPLTSVAGPSLASPAQPVSAPAMQTTVSSPSAPSAPPSPKPAPAPAAPAANPINQFGNAMAPTTQALLDRIKQPTAPKAPAPQAAPLPAQPSTPMTSVPNPTLAGPAPASPTGPAMQTTVSSPSTPPPPQPQPAPPTLASSPPATINQFGDAMSPTTQALLDRTNQPPAPPQPVSKPTTESPDTPIQPEVKQSPSPAAQTAGMTLPPEMQAKFDDPKVPPEEKQKIAHDFVQQRLDQNPEMRTGMQDLHAGRDTPAARAFKQQVDQAGNDFIKQEYARLKQANPNSTPQQEGGFINAAMQNWQQMPEPMKWMMGLGLGGGLLSLFSGLFGEGGMGMGALGLLGLGGAGLAGAAGGLFGDDARRLVGQGAVGAANLFGAEIPKAETIQSALSGGGAGQSDAVQRVQAVMNAAGADGKPGGWAAGQTAIGKSRADLERLLSLGRHHGSTMLMGLPGGGAPQTAEAAGQMYDQLAAKHKELGDPMFLRNQARQAALAQLEAANKEHGGAFDNMFRARGLPGGVLNNTYNAGTHAVNAFREDQILQTMLKNPELKRYLSKTPDGRYYQLPQGASYEDFADQMLTNAYGAYPGEKKAGALNIAEKLAAEFRGLKLARCWASNKRDATEKRAYGAEDDYGLSDRTPWLFDDKTDYKKFPEYLRAAASRANKDGYSLGFTNVGYGDAVPADAYANFLQKRPLTGLSDEFFPHFFSLTAQPGTTPKRKIRELYADYKKLPVHLAYNDVYGQQPAPKNVGALVAKTARCWAGYEPVPGAKAYSRGSCRPVGSKKTQKEMKNGKERHEATK